MAQIIPPPRQFPSLSYIYQGITVCDTQTEKGHLAQVDETYCQYNFPAGMGEYDAVTDQEISGNFDTSRIPPRISFRLEAARRAVGEEITDLLKLDKGSPPATIEIRLDDPRYCHSPRIPSTLVIKRKSVGLYRDRLCTRGDVAPLSATGFVSIPTVRRSSIKIARALDVSTPWGVRALGISKAFLQSENMRPGSRLLVIPPQWPPCHELDHCHLWALT